MLCSMSALKSNSNWLDRLRSSKGIPSGDDIDFEQFLTDHNQNLSNSSDNLVVAHSTANAADPNPLRRRNKPEERPVLDRIDQKMAVEQNGEREMVSAMNNVLAELFNMGEDSQNLARVHGKRGWRKQTNPKFCVGIAPSNAEDTGNDSGRRDEHGSPALPSSGDSSHVEIKEMGNCMMLAKAEEGKNGCAAVDGQEEEKFHADLSGFSRTEVTVIDTSCPSWKFEKLLFRRRNVWKVRDKKSKAANLGKKKRKGSLLGESVNGEKKQKLTVGHGDMGKETTRGDEFVLPLTEGINQSGKKKEADYIFGQVNKKRFSKKFNKRASSVVLIKSIPTSKKNGVNVTKSTLKLTQRQIKG